RERAAPRRVGRGDPGPGRTPGGVERALTQAPRAHALGGDERERSRVAVDVRRRGPGARRGRGCGRRRRGPRRRRRRRGPGRGQRGWPTIQTSAPRPQGRTAPFGCKGGSDAEVARSRPAVSGEDTDMYAIVKSGGKQYRVEE